MQWEAASIDRRFLVLKQLQAIGPRTDFKESRVYAQESIKERNVNLKEYGEDKMGLGYSFLALWP